MAVDDIKSVQDNAVLQRLAMQVFLIFEIAFCVRLKNSLQEIRTSHVQISYFIIQVNLNLDVEKLLPDFIRRRIIIRKESVRPNEKRNPILKFLLDDTTLKRIASAVVVEGNEVLQ